MGQNEPPSHSCGFLRIQGVVLRISPRIGRINRGVPQRGTAKMHSWTPREAQQCVRGTCSGNFLYLTVESRHLDKYQKRFRYISDTYQCARVVFGSGSRQDPLPSAVPLTIIPDWGFLIDLLMGLFRGAVFRHGGGALKQPIKQPTETPTSTLALMGRFPLLMGRFPTLMGRFTDFVLRGRFNLLKIHWKTAH